MLVSREIKKNEYFSSEDSYRNIYLDKSGIIWQKKIYNFIHFHKKWKLPQLLSTFKMRVMEDLNIKMELFMKVSGEL